jgi:hypothetical protein
MNATQLIGKGNNRDEITAPTLMQGANIEDFQQWISEQRAVPGPLLPGLPAGGFDRRGDDPAAVGRNDAEYDDRRSPAQGLVLALVDLGDVDVDREAAIVRDHHHLLGSDPLHAADDSHHLALSERGDDHGHQGNPASKGGSHPESAWRVPPSVSPFVPASGRLSRVAAARARVHGVFLLGSSA